MERYIAQSQRLVTLSIHVLLDYAISIPNVLSSGLSWPQFCVQTEVREFGTLLSVQ
jgi:hypothetical protein